MSENEKIANENSDGARPKIAYLLPNLFTAGSAFLAFLAIVAASGGNFDRAFWFVVVSSIFDALDGRVARLTGTSSQFGKEFDSLADAIAFGVAPALIMYFALVSGLDGEAFRKFGILIVALFAIFGAVRLARFNIISSKTEPNVFIGLPIPAAALVVVSMTVLVASSEPSQGLRAAALTAAGAVAILMVSNIRYPSFKQMHIQKANFLKILIALIVLFSLFYLYQVIFLAVIAAAYAAYGPARALLAIVNRKRKAINENEQTDKNI